MISQMHADGREGLDYIIVLGAQVRKDGPSPVLKYRLDKAVEYLNENPDTVCIVSGGQGSNEPGRSREQQRIADFANKVHAGEITNAAGEKFTTVVQIGIGGSDLGPRAMYLALENWAKKNNTFKMEAKFISNVDPDDAAAVLNSVDVAHSIFVLVSKSGTTLETLTNESFVKDALKKAGPSNT